MNNETRNESAAAARRAMDRELVTGVAKVYKQFRTLPPLVAINHDPNPASRSMRWSPDTAGFVIDCERAVQKTIEGKRAPDTLFEAWERLQEDDAVLGVDGARFIQLAAPIFASRRLHPREYFKRNRYPQRKAVQ